MNECEINMDSCDVNADCTNTDGSYTCSCSGGYSVDGTYCFGKMLLLNKINNILLSNLDIDECATNMDICAEKAMCDNTHGSFLALVMMATLVLA